MYIPKEFEVKDLNKIKGFLAKNTFATLISIHEDEAIVSHLPLVCKWEKGTLFLEGHISLANAQASLLKHKQKVKVVIQGEHGYISSSVYHHHNVPTWNYQAVHLSTRAEQLSTADLESHLTELVDQYESKRQKPLKYADFDRQMLDSYLKEIVGFRLQAEKIEAAFKLSQNRNEEDFQAILTDLNECPHLKGLASAMEESRK
jgi:transcriptional regulator